MAPAEEVASAVMLLGSVRTGAVVSLTVTVKKPVLVLLELSVVEQLTVVTAMGKTLPALGEQVTNTGPSMASMAL